MPGSAGRKRPGYKAITGYDHRQRKDAAVNTALTTAFITTIRERCRMCYTCVRECPAKAIRITEGQAEVLGERCIACGNCVRVCSQRAKLLRSTIDQAWALLRCGGKVAAYEQFCKLFDDQTKNASDMSLYNRLLTSAVDSIAKTFQKRVAAGLQTGRDFIIPDHQPKANETADFELVTWLVIQKPL